MALQLFQISYRNKIKQAHRKSIRFLNSVCAIFTFSKQDTFHQTYQSTVVYKYPVLINWRLCTTLLLKWMDFSRLCSSGQNLIKLHHCVTWCRICHALGQVYYGFWLFISNCLYPQNLKCQWHYYSYNFKCYPRISGFISNRTNFLSKRITV